MRAIKLLTEKLSHIKRLAPAALSIFVLAACGGGSDSASSNNASNVAYLNQAWSNQDRADYYWGSQGSALISYDIYLALQLPNSNERFNSAENADRLGLLVDSSDAKNNPDNLPIGVSKTAVESGQFAGTYIGLTCAACHTGQIQYKNQQVRIDGGVAGRFDINNWIKSLSASLDATLADPARFQTMLNNIQKTGTVNEADLRSRLIKDAAIVKNQLEKSFVVPFNPGPGRMDALGSIHNSFIGINTGQDLNLRQAGAPVKPPFLWNAPQSSWVQWSGIAQNPLRRNLGETLGVFARYNLKSGTENEGLFETTSDIKGLVKLENLLKRLAPPKWPEHIFGALDPVKVQAGEKLFSDNCSGCHATFPYRWSEARGPGKRFIENALVPLSVVGTDTSQWKGVTFSQNAEIVTAQLNPFFGGAANVTAGQFMQVVMNKMLQKAIAKAGPFSDAEMDEITSYTDIYNDPPGPGPVLTYKAGPRDGVWATGPFLHNGSVPNIYELLSPATERSKRFYVTREFDPVKLGINTDHNASSAYLFDTSLAGNSNAGHSFQAGSGSGIIGRELKHVERLALIEYLKSIPNAAGRVTPYGGPDQPVIAKDDRSWFHYLNPYLQYP